MTDFEKAGTDAVPFVKAIMAIIQNGFDEKLSPAAQIVMLGSVLANWLATIPPAHRNATLASVMMFKDIALAAHQEAYPDAWKGDAREGDVYTVKLKRLARNTIQ